MLFQGAKGALKHKKVKMSHQDKLKAPIIENVAA